MELSLCMIVRNESESLARCLESVADIVDEIVILDTGSSDDTREIARRYTPCVYDYAWQDDFAAARNAAFSYAAKPYLFWLDADDVLEEAARVRLAALKPRLDGTVDAVMMPYHYAHDRSGRPTLVFERERIVRADAGFRFDGRVHEAMAVSGRILREDIVIRHMRAHDNGHTQRNLSIYEGMLAQGEALTQRDRYYYARELMAAGRLREAVRAFSACMDATYLLPDVCLQRGKCMTKLGEYGQAKRQLLLALAEKPDRAEALCALGEACMTAGEDDAAIFWYRAALLCAEPEAGPAFTEPEAYDYIPLMQLCVLLDRKGDHCGASRMNERALLVRPGDEAALQNRAYFGALFERERMECTATERERAEQEG